VCVGGGACSKFEFYFFFRSGKSSFIETIVALQEMSRSNPITATGRMKITKAGPKKGWIKEEKTGESSKDRGSSESKEKEKRLSAASQSGLYVIAYHFCRANNAPSLSAANFTRRFFLEFFLILG